MSAVVETPKTRPKRQYSDSDKTRALYTVDAFGGNVRKASQDTGIPYRTLMEWTNGVGIHQEIADIRLKKSLPLADRLDSLTDEIVEAMPRKIAKASLQAAGTTVGILIDKTRLLRGESTENHSLSVSIDDRRDALAAAFFAQQRELAGKCSGESELNAVDCVEGEFEDIPPVE